MLPLLVVLGLLVMPGVVHAEGAWVLWGQAMDPWGALTRFSLGSWPSREACEAERARKEQGLAPLVSYFCLAHGVTPSDG
jgi:hypothetical protein